MTLPTKEEIIAFICRLPEEDLYTIYSLYQDREKNMHPAETNTPSENAKVSVHMRSPKCTIQSNENTDKTTALTQVFICPHCSSSKIVKYGRKNNKQRYRCDECRKIFVTSSNTIMAGSHSTPEQWYAVIRNTLAGESIDSAAKETGLHHETVFNMRHKILLAIEKMAKENPVILSEVSELDETYVEESYKGVRQWQQARDPHKRGEHASKRGISTEKVCICTGIQRGGTAMMRSVNRAKPSSSEIEKVFVGHISDNALVLTDGLKGYSVLQQDLQCKVVVTEEKEDSFYHLNNVNSLHSQFKEQYRAYRGVATKYINRYATMFAMSYRNREQMTSEIFKKICGVSILDYSHTNHDVKSKGLLAI